MFPKMKLLVVILLKLFPTIFCTILTKDINHQVVYSVVDGSANLPCNITPPLGTKEDGARLVLWYKDANPQPVYSFDARFLKPKHWSQDPNFGSRSFFRQGSDQAPAQLIVSGVTMKDAGTYKCRVDFKMSQTVTHVIELKIIEEPEKPTIMDPEGSAIMGTVGPFRLKQALILTCLVTGGNPTPEVIWFRDGEVWDRQLDPSTYEDVLQNTLVISELAREHHGSIFECRAINNNVTNPPSSKVTVSIEMPILSMTIANLPDPVTFDTSYQILCQIIGAQPPPKVKWYLDDFELPSTEPSRLTHDNNLTTSQLVFTPKTEDQGKLLTCVADNSVFPKVNKSSELNVYFAPTLFLELEDDQIDPTHITEGDSITFKCIIQAHPWIWRIEWLKDGESLQPTDGVIIEDNRLTIRNITKKMSGQYVCGANNVEGSGYSNGLKISINYKPVCSAPTIQSKDSGIDLICTVDSKPLASTYRWLFNSSETTFEIPSAESTMFFSNYKSSTDEGHGQVLCWASNNIGEQKSPCVFHVVPLGSPSPPKECKVSNYSVTTVEVKCHSGFSGGLSQRYIMEVFETVNNSQVLVASNWTDLSVGSYQEVTLGVWGLLPDSDYIISVKASNERGESSPIYVGGSTRFYQEDATMLPRHEDLNVKEGRMPLLFVIVGILVTLMIMGALLTAILAVRRQRAAKLNQIEIQSGSSSGEEMGDSSNTPKSSSELQEALIKPEESKIQRKVSFRETPMASYIHCPECETEARLKNQQQRPLTPPIFNPIQRTNVPPIQRAVVRTFSIDKLRPVCPVCNPVGETPYPLNGGFCTTPSPTNRNGGSCTPLKNGSIGGSGSKSSSPVKNNNKMDTEEEVRRLNSELSELQQSLLDGAAELAAFKDDHD